jgi:hypothetical protein
VLARTDFPPCWPEVLFWAITRLAEFLLAAEVAFCRLHRGVAKQKLNLFKFPARQMA